MRPRRLRSSMRRVAIMAPVGIHDPRWSPTGADGAGAAGVTSVTVVIPIPQSARDLQEPLLERGLDLLQPVDRDPVFDQVRLISAMTSPVPAGR
jgi:hypothetical protein